MTTSSSTKVGYVAIVGLPNVGKSTLLNQLLGARLAAVSPKAQTTRHKILGILSGPSYQILFLDTPGIMQKPGDELDRRMLKRVAEAIEDADVVSLLVEPKMPGEQETQLIEQIRQHEKPSVLVINKVDTVTQGELSPILMAYRPLYPFAEILPISALLGAGLDRLLQVVVELLPEGHPFYPDDQFTDRPERFFVAEQIREQIYLQYGDEIPYDTAVEVVEFHEAQPEVGRNKDYIRAVIYVNKESQKKILIGTGGAAIKKLGEAARRHIEAFLGRPVFLELWVKVRKKWRQNPAFLQQLGY
jgi:GTP-binding protein Era